MAHPATHPLIGSTAGANEGFDTVVVGGIGSATLYRLALRLGPRVPGPKQFALGQPDGGSHDHSRIIRLMYHDARYTALTPRTFTAWDEVAAESGVELLVKTGGLEMAAPVHHADIDRYAAAMDAAAIPHERFGAEELRQLHPQFTAADDVAVRYQESSGLVNAAKGNAVHVAPARAHGAQVRTGCTVHALIPQSDSVRVESSAGDFLCRRVVVAAAS